MNSISSIMSYKTNQTKNYSLEDIAIAFKRYYFEVYQIKLAYVDEPRKYHFHELSSFKRVINLCELINENEVTAEKITEEF
ncbi:MAG: hypothetical protein ACLU5J_06575 [Christensenellales bacterium]